MEKRMTRTKSLGHKNTATTRQSRQRNTTNPPSPANPVELRQHLMQLPAHLRSSIMKSKNKGVLKNILKWAFATPYGVKANCYAHFLALPNKQWQDRRHKTQPGDKCQHLENMTKPLNFQNRAQASKQLIERVLCDNYDRKGLLSPNNVKRCDSVYYIDPLQGGYSQSLLQMKLPIGYILGCCIVGDRDYHFCRREGIDEMLLNKDFNAIWRNDKTRTNEKDKLELLQSNGHTYCWSHISGWSNGLKLVDGNNMIITNPVPDVARNKAARQLLWPPRCSHTYEGGLSYDTFVGFFIVKARSATVKDDNKMGRNDVAVQKRLWGLGIVT
jgi:hypothetical protein